MGSEQAQPGDIFPAWNRQTTRGDLDYIEYWASHIISHSPEVFTGQTSRQLTHPETQRTAVKLIADHVVNQVSFTPRYTVQNSPLTAPFYAPLGDVIERIHTITPDQMDCRLPTVVMISIINQLAGENIQMRLFHFTEPDMEHMDPPIIGIHPHIAFTSAGELGDIANVLHFGFSVYPPSDVPQAFVRTADNYARHRHMGKIAEYPAGPEGIAQAEMDYINGQVFLSQFFS